MSLEVCQPRRMTYWLVLQRGLQDVAGRPHGLRRPIGPKMLRRFTPRSGTLSSSSQPGSRRCRGPGVPPSEGELRSSQEGPELHPALLTLLSPLTTLSGPGREGRGGHLAKLAPGPSL